MKGTLSEGAIAGILRELYVGRKSGLLNFTKGGERRSVRFYKGNIIHADTNVKDERLGETLVRRGLLSAADLKRATGFVLRDKRRLGEVLKEMGVLDKDQLEDALALQVREILLKIFSWSEGEYAFEPNAGDVPGDHDATLKLSTGEMILEAARSVGDPDVVRYSLGNIDRILGLSSDPLLRFQKVALSPADGFVLSRVDGTLSAREIIQMNTAPPEETAQSLYGLLCTGILEYLPVPPKPTPKPEARRPTPAAPPRAPEPPPSREPPPAVGLQAVPAAVVERGEDTRRREILDAYETLRSRNHFEILGIEKGSTDAQIKEAYFRLAKRFHPDAHHDPALADLADKLEAVFIRLGEAYELLRNAHSRASYEAALSVRASANSPAPPPTSEAPAPADPAQEAAAADEAYRRAQKHFEKEQYWDAIQLLEPALPKVQGKARNKVRVLLAKAYLKNPKWVKRAEEQLQIVAREDASNFDAHFLLGTIYKSGGLKSRAIHSFERVLEIKPDHEAAAAELASLQDENPTSPPGSGGGGLLKKIFGKS
jgi:tetratricopeptide (TPR) repeat protein